ncbi:MAG TPA: DUF1549 and DUF1553 domain-containing protein [Blastocatellia bacterium]|nr:DUF1549 and DUF1553 domain-containing protein [Blastocatellia bacterium]
MKLKAIICVVLLGACGLAAFSQPDTRGKHWAYIKPVWPAIPSVKNTTWPRNAIDRFVLARLEREGLRPAPDAAKETLIRRVYLDLTGLPPSVEEVEAFVADNRADAYERVVDRLLASPHYGERWARPWLDLARYADTNGYEKDQRRTMWMYRDWVIGALNRDMPFDQFTVEQLAGDMLPNASDAQRIATGFHRNTLLNQEGGIDPEEARWETLIDRVNTTATVWLGSTLGCAQCHDHKYDPFTQKDFYRFLAFFDNAEYQIEGNGSERFIREPALLQPTAEQATRREQLLKEIAALDAKLKTPTFESARQQVEWEHTITGAAADWTPLEFVSASSSSGAQLSQLADHSLLAAGGSPGSETYTITGKLNLANITALRLEALPDASLPRGGPGRDPYGIFALHGIEVEVYPAASPAARQRVVFKEAFSDDADARGLLKKPASAWTVDQTNDDKRLPRQAVFVLQSPMAVSEAMRIEIRLRQDNPMNRQSLGRLRLSVTAASAPETITRVTARLRPLLDVPAERRTPEQRTALRNYFVGIAPSLKATRQQLAAARTSLAALNIPSAEVMRERDSFERPATDFHVRGGFLNKGERVYADVPACLPRLAADQMPNRLGLARWLVSDDNPLVARVTVNRFWEALFGRGLVETSEDFGTQGQAPTHPELLDWLAMRFMRGGWGGRWSMKSLVRLIVTSATYRQSSRVTAELLERDPYNKLLARGPRFRIEAEMVRDVTLAASGLLSRKVGGPSVFPLQPEGIWNIPYNADRWQTSKGEDRYRRGLYTFIRRTSPYPMLTAFDAPSREQCTVRRPRTNTPLQALTTLNDEAFVEMARALAKRMDKEAAGGAAARLAYGFRLCTARRPAAREVKRLVALYEKERARFTADAASARALLKDDAAKLDDRRAAEMAAMTVIANVLLNLDETLTKE